LSLILANDKIVPPGVAVKKKPFNVVRFVGRISVIVLGSLRERLIILFQATRPKFLIASAAPVLVGTSLDYATAGSFQPHLFVLALLAGSFALAALMLTEDRMFFAGLFYLFTLPLAVFAIKLVNGKNLTKPG